jgi:hypothetical protein
MHPLRAIEEEIRSFLVRESVQTSRLESGEIRITNHSIGHSEFALSRYFRLAGWDRTSDPSPNCFPTKTRYRRQSVEVSVELSPFSGSFFVRNW